MVKHLVSGQQDEVVAADPPPAAVHREGKTSDDEEDVGDKPRTRRPESPLPPSAQRHNQPPAWTLRGMFFWHYLGISFVMPFLVLWMRKAGLSNAEIGMINTLRPLLGMVVVPVWGLVADKFNTKAVLLLLLCISTVLRFSIHLMTSFWPLLFLVLLSDFFGAPIEPFLDSTCMSSLVDASQYGVFRVFGTIGYGWVGVPVAGQVMASFDIATVFWVHLVLMMFPILLVSSLKVIAPADDKRGSIWDAVGVARKSQATAFFFIAALMVGQSLGLIGSFSFLMLQDLGDTGVMMGLATMAQCLAEAPVFFVSQWILNRTGVIRAMQVSLFAVSIRFGVYATMTRPWHILLVEWLHGPMYGLMWVSGTRLCRSLAPAGMETSVQSLFSSWVMGFGSLSGNMMGGFLASHYGVPYIFGVFSVAILFVSVAVIVAESVGLLDLRLTLPDSQRVDSPVSVQGTKRAYAMVPQVVQAEGRGSSQ